MPDDQLRYQEVDEPIAHWEIQSGHYADGAFHLKFHDGTSGSVSVSQFPELAIATEAELQSVQVSPSMLVITNDRIDWDYAESGLYGLVTG